MELQKINWKLFFKDPSGIHAHDFFKVFNTWIPDAPEVFIDVADYSHVPEGPVTLLDGYYADFVLDRTDKRLGLLYSRKIPMDGSDADKLKSTFQSLVKGCQRVEQDATFAGKAKFETNEILFMINDRAIAPNTKETFARFQPLLQAHFDALLGKGQYELTHLDEPKKRFRVLIKSKANADLTKLAS